jgi:hypothetical protein
LFFSVAACEYNPPPEIQSSTPGIGAVTTDAGTDIVVRFTEPIDPQTLQATLYLRKLTGEGELLPDCSQGGQDCINALAGPCAASGDCPNATLTLSQDNTVLTFDPDEDFKIGEYVLRIPAGLEDLDGNASGVPYDVMFFVSRVGTGGATTFQPGVYLAWMELEQPFTFQIETYWHMRVEADIGKVWGGGCDGDQIDPDGPYLYDHESWKPVPYLDQEGFKFVFLGLVQDAQVQDQEGNPKPGFILETHPFYIYCAQPEVQVMDGRITVSIYHDDEMGREVMHGRMNSDETYILGAEHASVATGTVYGYRLRPDEVGDGKSWLDCSDPVTYTRPE